MRKPRASRARYFSPSQIREILKRDNHTCIYCWKPATLIDHIVSWELGGKTISENGVACCKSCNKLKENDTLGIYVARGMEYIAKLKG